MFNCPTEVPYSQLNGVSQFKPKQSLFTICKQNNKKLNKNTCRTIQWEITTKAQPVHGVSCFFIFIIIIINLLYLILNLYSENKFEKIQNFAKKFCLLVSLPTIPTFLTHTIHPHSPTLLHPATLKHLIQNSLNYSIIPPKNKHTTASSRSAALLHSPVANISGIKHLCSNMIQLFLYIDIISSSVFSLPVL